MYSYSTEINYLSNLQKKAQAQSVPAAKKRKAGSSDSDDAEAEPTAKPAAKKPTYDNFVKAGENGTEQVRF